MYSFAVDLSVVQPYPAVVAVRHSHEALLSFAPQCNSPVPGIHNPESLQSELSITVNTKPVSSIRGRDRNYNQFLVKCSLAAYNADKNYTATSEIFSTSEYRFAGV